MYKNFLKIVFRNLWKYKGYTLLNVVGMAVGIAAMVWGYQTYRFSFSFDDFHRDRQHVYRALTYRKDAEGLKGIFPTAAVQTAKAEFPGIKEAVRYDSRRLNVKYNTGDVFSEPVHFTDPAFFTLFDFPLVAGNNDLTDPNAVLLTETVAKKYFGNQNPVGKVLTFYAGETYAMPVTVKGVLKDVPLNSSMQFGMITRFENQLKSDAKKITPDDWGWFADAVFFYIPAPADAERLEKGLARYLPLQNKAREDVKLSGFKLVTLQQNAEWRNVIGFNGLHERPDTSAAYGPLVLAFLIFLSACLNFSNTTVARANRRLKEIGMRKVMGSTHAQLMGQLLLECSLIVAASVLLSTGVNNWWMPAFNSMFGGISVGANYLHDTPLLVFLLCMLVSATMLAGAYPAFYISRFSPTSIFRGTVKFGGSNLFSRLMLGLQLTIAIITVVAGIAFARNSAFQRDYDYGYTIENTMGVALNDSTAYAAFKNSLSSLPGITALTGTRNHIGFNDRNEVAEAEGAKKEVTYLEVGRDYPQTMGLKMAAGRGFDAALESDYATALLITQKAAALFGWKEGEAVGKRMHLDSTDYNVVGVLKDFHSESLFDPTQPVVMKLGRERRFQYLIVQAKPQDLTRVYAKVKDAWKGLFPLKPFDGFYQNGIKAEAYQTTTSIATIFFWFAIVSILLTATGLFALVSLTALKKMKEIAMRKVVGARPRHILLVINKDYFWIFGIAAFAGCYGGWALSGLLLNSIFKINAGVQPVSLVGSVIVLFAIAAVTSGIKVWQAVRTNPVKLLRAE